MFLQKLITLKVKISISLGYLAKSSGKIFSCNICNGQTSLQMLSDMDQNGMSGIVRQSEEEPAKAQLNF